MTDNKLRAPKNLAAVIFDMDGVLIDSEHLWRRSEMLVLNELGVPLTDEMCKQTMGLRLDEMVDYWFERYPWSGKSVQDVAAGILKEVVALVKAEGEALPGVDSLIKALGAGGQTLALASSSPEILIHCVLDRLGLGDAFSVVCSAEHEKLGKPDPAVYLTCARRLGVEPARCLAIEDSLNGVLSARAAGMQVVAVPEAGNDEGFEVPIFSSLAEVEAWLFLC